MLLSELYSNLSLGALQNLAVGGSGSGVIPVEQYPKVGRHVIKGLNALFHRFYILSKSAMVRTHDGQTRYELQRRYADQDPTVVPRKWIADSADDPFLGDVIKIVSVLDETGEPVALNDPNDERSVFTPYPQTLEIPEAVTGDAYLVIYQAAHPPIDITGVDQELMIPPVLEDVLEYYVAGQILSNMLGEEHTAKGMEFLARFEHRCKMITDADLLNTSLINETYKFYTRGFV